MAEPALYHVTFLRHGESVGNLENRFQGHADFPLTETGRAQVRALVERWRTEGCSFDRAFSSPLLRARETAEIICEALSIPLEIDSNWMEIDNGLLAGLNEEEAARSVPLPAVFTPYTHTGRTGESRWEVYLRAGENLQKLVDYPPGRMLVVAHGGILNMVLYAILGIPAQIAHSGARFTFRNTTYATLSYEPESHIWRLLHFDNRPQWKEE
jgi:2,3-bisphosphoglycerate-dependent phosphoglycerate mutase